LGLHVLDNASGLSGPIVILGILAFPENLEGRVAADLESTASVLSCFGAIDLGSILRTSYTDEKGQLQVCKYCFCANTSKNRVK
jgi:hypothetical protein